MELVETKVPGFVVVCRGSLRQGDQALSDHRAGAGVVLACLISTLLSGCWVSKSLERAQRRGEKSAGWKRVDARQQIVKQAWEQQA